MFRTRMAVDEACAWFRGELLARGFRPVGEIENSKYDLAFSVASEGGTHDFWMFHTPAVENGVCLYVKPSLKLFAALFGKRDALREQATVAAHEILSGAGHVEDLGWFTEQQVWRGPTSEP